GRKRVHLKLKDTPVLDAVAELQKQSGYPIQVMGDRTGVADKKITLDTGATTFWEALDQLCRAAGLTEAATVGPAQPGLPGGFQMRQLPPQFLPVPAQPARAVPGRGARAKPGAPAIPAVPLQRLVPARPQAPGILPVVPPAVPKAPQIFQIQGAQGGGQPIQLQIQAP